MESFFWIIDLLIPVMTIVIGLLFRFLPPKKINMLYGYRTYRSMSSQEAWDAAHRLCGKAYLWIGIGVAAFVAADKWMNPLAPEWLSLFHAALGLASLIIPIPFIEKKLKAQFNK
jgi:uncharacterized membrane protein